MKTTRFFPIAALLTVVACQVEDASKGADTTVVASAPPAAAAPDTAQPSAPPATQPSTTASSGAIAAPPANGSGAVIASQETNWPGVVADVTEFRRRGNVLTAKVRFRNTGTESVRPDFLYSETYLMDAATKKYEVLKDENSNYIAALHSGYSNRWYEDIPPGSSLTVWMKFPAPPVEVSTVTLSLPKVLPFEDLPIQDS